MIEFELFTVDEINSLAKEYGFNPSYILDFLKKEDFAIDEIKSLWSDLYREAYDLEDRRKSRSSSAAAVLLAHGAMQIIVYMDKLEESEKDGLKEFLLRELYRAMEEDGIGMYSDSEWIYMEYEKYL